MKITFVFDGLQFGGIERVGVEYIKLLSGRNYAITVETGKVISVSVTDSGIKKTCTITDGTIKIE